MPRRAAMKPEVPATVPLSAEISGHCDWCEACASQPNQPFVVLVGPAGDSSAVGAWTLVPRRHVGGLTGLTSAEIGCLLAGLVGATSELARLSGALHVRVIPDSTSSADAPQDVTAGSSRRRRRGHVRFHLVPQFSVGADAFPSGRKAQGWPRPSSSMA